MRKEIAVIGDGCAREQSKTDCSRRAEHSLAQLELQKYPCPKCDALLMNSTVAELFCSLLIACRWLFWSYWHPASQYRQWKLL